MQTFASELALILEQREKAEAFTDQFKLAVISADPVKMTPLMFPDWWQESKKDKPAEEEILDPDADTIYRFSEQISEEEFMREFLSNPTVTVSAGEVDDGTWI